MAIIWLQRLDKFNETKRLLSKIECKNIRCTFPDCGARCRLRGIFSKYAKIYNTTNQDKFKHQKVTASNSTIKQ